jgi:hypothetical protein
MVPAEGMRWPNLCHAFQFTCEKKRTLRKATFFGN